MQRLHVLCALLWIGILLYGQSSNLEKALSAAGENRVELENVLQHYKHNESDSLKWKAACFLIENMPAHYTFVGAAVDTFYTVMGKIFAQPGNKGKEYYNAKYDSVFVKWGFALDQSMIRLDVKTIKADYLIKNIDEAFEMWKAPWGVHVTLDQFCEYILPYRLGNEPLSDWRTLFKQRKPEELGLLKARPNATFMYGLCNVLNKGFIGNLYVPSSFMPEYSLASLINLKCATCRDYSNQGAAQMRAMGIPVAVDFVPQWAGRSMGHEWNVLFRKKVSLYLLVRMGYQELIYMG